MLKCEKGKVAMIIKTIAGTETYLYIMFWQINLGTLQKAEPGTECENSGVREVGKEIA